MESNRLAIGSRLVCLKFVKTVYFLSYAYGRRKNEEKRRRKKMNKIEILNFGFSKFLKVSGTFGVDKTLEY